MSDASSTAQQPPATEARARYHRSAKNYLLDPRFQLKYTSLLVGIAAVLSVALGLLLWKSSNNVLLQSQQAVQQGQITVRKGQETVKRGQEVIVQSRRVSQVVAMNIAKEYKDDPELAKTFGESAQHDAEQLKEEQERLEREAVDLQQRAHDLEQQAAHMARQQATVLIVLVVILTALVIGVGIAGIIFTHKVAGPIFKMKRLLRQVGEGKLVVRERLRKGDELQHFFETFEKMVDDLRTRQQQEIVRVDEAIEKLEAAGRDHGDDGVALLKKLRRELQEQIEA
jgi:nitrogen fixation/metabolism regulation signal transduction histidine kinase